MEHLFRDQQTTDKENIVWDSLQPPKAMRRVSMTLCASRIQLSAFSKYKKLIANRRLLTLYT